MVEYIFRFETLIPLCVTLYFYRTYHSSWMLFMIGIILPDMSIITYSVSKNLGTIIFNIFHTYLVSVLLIFIGKYLNNPGLISIGLLWTAHVSFDRFIRWPEI